jgi:ubiquinone/menaquinone biosynthesis C-methylase UbiE
MNNRWNRFIYRLWAPVYDSTVDRLFRPGRRRALELLDLQAEERALLPGIGTGADLPFLPGGVDATGIDLSPAMLAKARSRLARCPASVQLIQGDAQRLLVEPASFDAAILNLILSVVPDGNACLRSAAEALRPGGRLVIFDKFLAEGRSPSPLRRFLNLFSTLFGTDINRRLPDLMEGCPLELVHDEPAILGGMYRAVLLRKIA